MTGRRAALAIVTIVTAGLVATALLSGFATIRGGDWTAGTNNTYWGVYWPHLDFYAEHAR